jgi:hypothetical protein
MPGLPPAVAGTVLRILATTDLGATLVPTPVSYGLGGTCAGIVQLLEREEQRQPTVWLDAGDLVVGPVGVLLGRRPWAEMARLPLAAAAAGNHEFDDGVPALIEAAASLPYPLLCANVDVGLSKAAIIKTDAGPLGVIGMTHPASHRFSQAPPPAEDWPEQIRTIARDLRRRGVLAIAVLLHDGVDWWSSQRLHDSSVNARSERLAAVAAGWAADVDLIVGGHTPASWTGHLAGKPAGHSAIFASSVLAVDVPERPASPVIRGVFRVPPVRPAESSEAIDVLTAAASETVGELSRTWISRTGAERYLPDLLAAALRCAAGTDAGLVFAAQHTTQGALDGTVAALPAGPISRLDVTRLFGAPDDRPAVVHLGPGEFDAAVAAHNAVTDPVRHDTDQIWWNWCRMPAGVSAGTASPRTVAVLPHIVPRLSEVLDRPIATEPATGGARAGLIHTLS